jgi:hypothetical protein
MLVKTSSKKNNGARGFVVGIGLVCSLGLLGCDETRIESKTLEASFSVPGGESVGPFDEAAVARAGNGDFVVVYRSAAGVFARLFDSEGAPRGPDFRVNQREGALEADVAMAADGRFVVVWRGLDEAGLPAVFARRFAADGTPMGDEITVNDPLAAGVGEVALRSPAVSINAAGHFVVAWAKGRLGLLGVPGDVFDCGFEAVVCAGASTHSVRARRFRQDAAEPERVVASSGTVVGVINSGLPAGVGLGAQIDRVDLAMAADDAFVVAWTRFAAMAGISPGVRAQRFSADGLPGPVRLVSLAPGITDVPLVGMDAAGAYAVAYQRPPPLLQGAEAAGIHLRFYDADALLGDPVQRLDEPSDGWLAGGHAMAMNASGKAVVVWRVLRPAQNRVDLVAQQVSAGGAVTGGNFVLGFGADIHLGRRGVAMDDAGELVVVWRDGTSGDVLARIHGPN